MKYRIIFKESGKSWKFWNSGFLYDDDKRLKEKSIFSNELEAIRKTYDLMGLFSETFEVIEVI